MLELPLSLLVVNLAQTPNWDLAAEIVNMTSRTFRNPKQCKWR
jgi:E1A-binding protein p400